MLLLMSPVVAKRNRMKMVMTKPMTVLIGEAAPARALVRKLKADSRSPTVAATSAAKT